MAQEIYHRSEWGNPNEQWGNVYLNADLTNELYKRASEYENSWVTDQLLNGVGTKPSIILTPTAYEDGVLNSVKTSDGNADFDFTRGSSATRVNEKGLVQDVIDTDLPRINYTNFDYENGEVVPYSGEGSLLLEPQSTNLITYSEDYSQSDWSKTNISITTNYAISPNGTINASLLTENSSNAQHFIGDALTLTSGTSYSVSVYAKKKERSVLQISPSSSHIASSYANYDLDLGVVSATGGSVTAEIEYLSNDWYRCILKFTVTSTATATLAFFMQTSTTATRGVSYQGNGTSGIYLWGAQVEAISYATSYISTNGSTVTRLADVCNNAGSSDLINSTEGVLYAEILKRQDDNDNFVLLSINNSSNNNDHNTVTVGFDNDDDFFIRLKANNVIAFYTNDQTASKDVYYKIALSYKSGDSKIYINGNLITPNFGSLSNTFTFGSTLNNLSFDYDGNGTLPFYGNVKCLAVFKEALSDTELQKLTT